MTYYIVYGIVAFFTFYLVAYFYARSENRNSCIKVYDKLYNIGDDQEAVQFACGILWPVFLFWLLLITIDHIMKKLINFFASKTW
jgi:hypothetical protein